VPYSPLRLAFYQLADDSQSGHTSELPGCSQAVYCCA
jgi:hypothetical protein